MAPEIKFTAFGIPYLVEFANVSFRSGRSKSKNGRPKQPMRANTYPTTRSFARPAPDMDTHSAYSYVSEPISSSWISIESSRSSIASSATAASSWSSSTAVSDSSTIVAPVEERRRHDTRGLFIQFSSPPLYPSTANYSSVTVSSTQSSQTSRTLHSSYPSASSHSTLSRSATIPGPRKTSSNALCRLRRAIEEAVLEAGMDTPTGERPNLHSRVAPTSPTGGADRALYRGTYGQVMSALKSAGLTTTPCAETGFDEATKLGAMFVVNHNEHGGVELTKLTLWG